MVSNLILIFILLQFILNLEYQKNLEILNKEQNPVPRVKEIENLDELKNAISSKQSIVLFYADWCGHCHRLLPIFEQASKYKLTENFEFLTVNCNQQSICDFYGVTRFPTTKVFLQGKSIKDEVPRDLENFVEFMDKLNSPAIIDLEENQIDDFIKNYGELSFLIINDNKEDRFYKCIEELSKNDYQASLYFGHLLKKEFITKLNEKVKSPALIMLGDNFGKDFILKIQEKDLINCEEIKEFIETNKFPIMRKLAGNYIKKLRTNKKIVIGLAVHQENEHHKKLLNETLSRVSIENRKFAFGYIDFVEESNIVKHLGISESADPILFAYNFDSNEYYIDGNTYSSANCQFDYLNSFARKILNKEIVLTTGNFVKDFFNKYDINFDENLVVISIFVFCLIALVIVVILVYCFDRRDNHEEFQEVMEKKNK